MQNVILVIHLLLAIGLVGVVLLQRSEGGGLGIGGGGGGGGMGGGVGGGRGVGAGGGDCGGPIGHEIPHLRRQIVEGLKG